MLEDILLVCMTPIYARSWVDAQLTNREVPSDQQTGFDTFKHFQAQKWLKLGFRKWRE